MRLFSFLVPLAISLSALYSTLDPTSVSQHFAFYELYPKTQEGREALKHAWSLLSGGCSDCDPEMVLPSLDPRPLIQFVNRSSQVTAPILDEEQIEVIDKLSTHLRNRNLKGFGLWDQEALIKLPSEEVDLGRGLLLAELGNSPDARGKIKSYEANLDLMALQIAARLPEDPSPLEIVRAMNDYVFSEMRFRFPPHSLHAKEIDIYTFLPSVIDGRRGVCLGVSILYLCLAQRLGVHLEAITPPGHIYVRCVSPQGEIVNIETTARGIDVPSEKYLGLETRKLQQRNLHQVIGLAFMNRAAVCWQNKNYEEAVLLYEKASPFMGEDDFLLNMFLGFNYLFIGKEKEGKKLLKKIEHVIPDHAISADTIGQDYLAGKTSPEGIQIVFSEVNETRASIIEKQEKLKKITAKFPNFRQGLFHLSITYLQLGREKEALPILEKLVILHPSDPTANYYLASIYFQRRDFNKAWKYLRSAESIVYAKDHKPQALDSLRQALQRSCPEPLLFVKN